MGLAIQKKSLEQKPSSHIIGEDELFQKHGKNRTEVELVSASSFHSSVGGLGVEMIAPGKIFLHKWNKATECISGNPWSSEMSFILPQQLIRI